MGCGESKKVEISEEELAAQKASGNAAGPYVCVFAGTMTVLKEMDIDSAEVANLSKGTKVDVLEVHHRLSGPGDKIIWGRIEGPAGWLALNYCGVTMASPAAPAAAPATAFSITEEELAAQSLAALKARAEELGCPLSHDDAVAVGEMMKSADTVTLPTSQAEVDEKLGQMKQMPKEAFDQMIEMVTMMAAKGKGKGK